MRFGWEPDGSHQIWDLRDTSDSELGQRRRITGFWINIETFWTHEKAISDARDARQHTLRAHSPDERDRKLIADLAPEKKPDPALRLLRHCRTLLILLVGLALLALFAGR
jgi:hypothetical protein